MHRLFTVALATSGLLVPPTRAQSPLTGLPAGFDSIVVVRDVLPSLQAALASDVLNTPLVRDQLEAGGVPLGAMRAGLALFARHVPVEIVVGAPPLAMAAGSHLWGAVAALIVRGEDRDDADALARLKTHVAALADVAFTGHVLARDAATAQLWFDTLVETLDVVPSDPALRVRIEGETIDLALEPLRFRGGQALARFGLPATLADELPLRWTLQLRHQDTRLAFRIGQEAPGALDATGLGPLWRNAPDQLFFGRLNAVAAILAMEGVLEFVADREEAIEAALEREPAFGAILESLRSRLEWTDPVTTYALNLIDGGVELLDHTDFGEGGDVEELPPGGVLGFVDPALSAFGALHVELDIFAHLVLEQLCDQARVRAARDAVAGRETFAARLLAFCDDELTPLREFFASEASECFASGTVIVLEGVSEVSAIAVNAPSRAAEAKLDACRLPAFALIGRLGEDADPWQFALACSASALATLGPAEEPLVLIDADLGLGVETRSVPWSAWARGGRTLSLVGDLQPHWFVHGGALAFSTSPALSRRLLARHRVAQQAPPAGVFGWWRYSGDAFADAVDQVTAALAVFAAPALAPVRAALGVESLPAGATTLAAVLDVVSVLARRIGRIEMLQRIDGRFYDDRVTVMWAGR